MLLEVDMNMRVLILLCMALASGVACAWIVFMVLQPKDSHLIYQESNTPLPPLPCSLNTSSCTITYQDSIISIESSTHPIQAIHPVTFFIKGFSNLSDDLVLKVYGLNMEMGTIMTQATKEGDTYQATINLGTCSLHTMRYRLALYEGIKPLGAFIDFDVEQ